MKFAPYLVVRFGAALCALAITSALAAGLALDSNRMPVDFGWAIDDLATQNSGS